VADERGKRSGEKSNDESRAERVTWMENSPEKKRVSEKGSLGDRRSPDKDRKPKGEPLGKGRVGGGV